MQNDQRASERLLDGKDDEKKTQILAFLQRRQQFRSHCAPHPANETTSIPAIAPLVPTAVPNSTKDAENPHEAASNDGPIAGTDLRPPVPLFLPPSHLIAPAPAFGLVVVCSSFRHLPSLSDKTKDVANQLFNALVDSHFARFSRRGSKLLINPSVIEFQDTMKELQSLCATDDKHAAFFLCLASHGARVTSGVNEGSYVLFSETRLSSEEELLLTAIHEQELAKLIHEIPCKNKFLALELCQAKQAHEKPADEAPTILNRVHENVSSRLYDRLVKLELVKQQSRRLKQPALTEAELLAPTSELFNTVILDSCVVKSEAPVRDRVDSVSNFLHRLSDAFHGAAATHAMEDDGNGPMDVRPCLRVRDICTYVERRVQQDALQQNDAVKAEYQKQLRTKYELVAEFQDITHTPQLVGLDRIADFSIGDFPAAPEKAPPTAPRFVSATLSSITIAWESDPLDGFHSSTSTEVPAVLGYHIQIRGDGRACETWRRACALQVLSFDHAVRAKMPLPSKAVVRGLACDAGFRFRLRARTAGGWGPFSDASGVFRTQSFASVHDAFLTAKHAFDGRRGVHGLMQLMHKHKSSDDTLRACIQFLARMAIPDPPRVKTNPERRLVPGLDAPVVVVAVCHAMHKFSRDHDLVAHACLLFGRLAQSHDAWRKCLLGIHEPHSVGALLRQAVDQFTCTHTETAATAQWALARLRGVSSRTRMSTDAAARRIQGLYRTRKAKEDVRALASSVYSRLVDPSTGVAYVYNTRTGATSWSTPRFLHC